MKRKKPSRADQRFFTAVKRAMPQAAKLARKVAIMHGTPLVILRDGKIVEVDPKTLR